MKKFEELNSDELREFNGGVLPIERPPGEFHDGPFGDKPYDPFDWDWVFIF